MFVRAQIEAQAYRETSVVTLPKQASDKFRSIKNSVTNAILDLWELEQHALANRREALASQLFQRQLELRRDFHELRKAEIAFLASEKSTRALVDTLDDVSLQAKIIQKKLQTMRTAEQGALEMLSLLRGMVTRLG